MSSFARMSRLSKIATASAVVGGSGLYFFRNQLKPYLISSNNNNDRNIEQTHQTKESINHAKHMLVEHLPEHIPYLLIGGGTASHSAMRAIRGHDPTARVLIIGSENHSPYMRPALSKELWYTDTDLREKLSFKWWNGKERSVFFEIDEFYIPIENLLKREHGGVSLIKNTKLTKLDPDSKTAYLENGQTIKYDKCLVATGGKPRTLPEFDCAPKEVRDHIMYFRTADDFLRLNHIAETAKSIVIVGGGFLGSELACSLSKRSSNANVPKEQVIYQIFPESGNLGKVLPKYLSEWLTTKIHSIGAQVKPNSDIESVTMGPDNRLRIKLKNSETIIADYIVAAVGMDPDVELAKDSGLEVDEKTRGYLVNSELEARTGVWVAGDASCFYDMKLGRRRVEHHDHAVNSGKLAGQNMTGAGRAYSHQSMLWSDLGDDLSFEAVGLVDSQLNTVSVFCEDPPIPNEPIDTEQEQEKDYAKESSSSPKEIDKYAKGIIFYLRDDIIVGVMLWNVFGRLNIARRLIHEQKKYDDFNEVAKLFNMYLDD